MILLDSIKTIKIRLQKKELVIIIYLKIRPLLLRSSTLFSKYGFSCFSKQTGKVKS